MNTPVKILHKLLILGQLLLIVDFLDVFHFATNGAYGLVLDIDSKICDSFPK